MQTQPLMANCDIIAHVVNFLVCIDEDSYFDFDIFRSIPQFSVLRNSLGSRVYLLLVIFRVAPSFTSNVNAFKENLLAYVSGNSRYFNLEANARTVL